MPYHRISKEEGGETVSQEVQIPHLRKSEEQRSLSLLEERRRNREAERYIELQPLPGEAFMAEKTQEQKDREMLNTEGDSFEKAQAAYEEKLKVENADTSAGTMTRIVGGEGGARFVPTPDVYQKEQGERSEGIPADDPLHRAGIGAGGDLGQVHDVGERALHTAKMGDEYSVHHATGPTSPEGAAAAAARGEIEAAAKAAEDPEKTREQDQKDAEKAAKAGAKAASQDAKKKK